MMNPDDPTNVKLISENNKPAFVPTTADTFANSKITVNINGENKIFDYADLTMATTLEMKNLKVKSIHTTDDEESSSFGALTLYCDVEGIPITVRTTVLKDKDNKLITEDAYLNKTIDVKGIVDCFHGEHQIKVVSAKDITIIE